MNDTETAVDLFVPGRICILGEHSDWAGGHRRVNSKVEKGYTIIAGTNQGLYATAKPHPTNLIFKSVASTGEAKSLDVPMHSDLLLSRAQEGGFFSYVAGVAYQIATHYHVAGIEIDNHKTDLPQRKGLSSSAAVCVLVARAFNRIYDLKMTTRGEMDFAYRGEITTPSRCGRMDQGCAYGNRPILMCFDGDSLEVSELSAGADLHFVIVDLCGRKDTIRILAELNRAYPFAGSSSHENAQNYLGEGNKSLVFRAIEAIKAGDAKLLGSIMSEAQSEFDRFLAPLCPTELSAPILHRLLHDKSLQQHTWGGKGVGSQGDGTAQLIARDAASQAELVEIVKREFSMPAFPLTMRRTQKIRKAVITAAGFGTRLFPMTKIIRKEFMPIFDKEGNLKPLILANVEEALGAGVEEILLIIQESERSLFERFFKESVPEGLLGRLSPANLRYNKILESMGSRLSFIAQPQSLGLGHAVSMARDWVKDEAFLLILGDHFFTTRTELSCAQQLVAEYERCEESVLGLLASPISEAHRFGCVSGEWEEKGKSLVITKFREKPDPDYARQYLTLDGLEADMVLTVSGQYILKPAVFGHLDQLMRARRYEAGEIQLTTALEELRKTSVVRGVMTLGDRIDIGVPTGYEKVLRNVIEKAPSGERITR